MSRGEGSFWPKIVVWNYKYVKYGMMLYDILCKWVDARVIHLDVAGRRIPEHTWYDPPFVECFTIESFRRTRTCAPEYIHKCIYKSGNNSAYHNKISLYGRQERK